MRWRWAAAMPGDGSYEERREAMVEMLRRQGFIRSEWMAEAALRVPREQFVPERLRPRAYDDEPLPIPGRSASISSMHTYCIYYEEMMLSPGDRVLEIGTGSGYGAALAREIVGPEGEVVTVELDPFAYEFARDNLSRTGYDDVVMVLSDGSEGHPEGAPYDKISITAACPQEPWEVLRQLGEPGVAVYPLGLEPPQELMILRVRDDGAWMQEKLVDVYYVPLRGKHGSRC